MHVCIYRPIIVVDRESVAASDDIGEASGVLITGDEVVDLILVMTVLGPGGASVDGIPVFWVTQQ